MTMGAVETIYERDFVEWTRGQAKALRAAKDSGVNLNLDWENLAEEIEDMGKSVRHGLASRIRTIIEHLLKLQCSRTAETRPGWELTVARERAGIEGALDDSPSLRRELDQIVQEETRRARRLAERAMRSFGDRVAPLPDSYTVAQVLEDWYPEPPA